MKTKTFDCVEMKREGSRRIYEQVKQMTTDEQVEFWRKKEQEFAERHPELKLARPAQVNRAPVTGR